LHRCTRLADNRGMFTRSSRKWVAWIASLAVILAAWMPAAPAGASASIDALILGSICASHRPAEPAVPGKSGLSHSHCGFCVVGHSLILASPAEVPLATVGAPESLFRAIRNELLPRDGVAVHPLSPRAPPRVA